VIGLAPVDSKRLAPKWFSIKCYSLAQFYHEGINAVSKNKFLYLTQTLSLG